MTDERLKKLTAFIIDQVRDSGGSLPKTKLVKLLYLIDVESMRQQQRPMTGLEWRYWHYGPYSQEIEKLLGEIVGKSISELEFITKDGRRIFTYQPIDIDEIESEYRLEERLIIYNTLKKWANEELRNVLNYVYFETEPMAKAKWGEILDLTVVRSAEDEKRWAPERLFAQVPQNKLTEFRERLRHSAKEAEQRKVPLPAYDTVFFEGSKVADSEDRKSLKHLVGSKGVISPQAPREER